MGLKYWAENYGSLQYSSIYCALLCLNVTFKLENLHTNLHNRFVNTSILYMCPMMFYDTVVPEHEV